MEKNMQERSAEKEQSKRGTRNPPAKPAKNADQDNPPAKSEGNVK